jgi:hypothetical protein
MTAPLRGHLSPLEQLVAEFVISAVPCPICHVPTGSSCAGLVCTLRRIAALDRYLGGPRCR